MKNCTIAYQSGGSYPHDLFIERELKNRLDYGFITYDDYLNSYLDGKHTDWIARRVDVLHRLLDDRPEAEFVLIGRSSGARAVAKYAGAKPQRLRGIVCIGYPFKHPDQPADPDRVAHLAHLAVPTLILQGDADEYGGADARDTYALSPSITFETIAARHDMVVSPTVWDQVAERIRGFIEAL